VILSTAAFLSALGFVAFLVGHVYGYQGIATIGAVLVVGLGAGVMVGGLDVAAGEERVEVNSTTTEIETVYDPIGTTSSFPLGLVLTLLGGVMTMRTLEGGRL